MHCWRADWEVLIQSQRSIWTHTIITFSSSIRPQCSIVTYVATANGRFYGCLFVCVFICLFFTLINVSTIWWAIYACISQIKIVCEEYRITPNKTQKDHHPIKRKIRLTNMVKEFLILSHYLEKLCWVRWSLSAPWIVSLWRYPWCWNWQRTA